MSQKILERKLLAEVRGIRGELRRLSELMACLLADETRDAQAPAHHCSHIEP